MARILILAAVLSMAALGQDAGSHQPHFAVERLADGVYALIRREPASLWFNPNNIFIIGKSGVVVIDSNISGRHTQEVLDDLRKLTDKPVRYVINTHWHDDHVTGNRVYRDAFPGAKFVGHRSTVDDLPTTGAANRKSALQNGRGFVGLLESKLELNENLAGQKISDEERKAYSSDIELVNSYLADSPMFEAVMPTVLVDDRLFIEEDGRKIEILFLGRAHTGGDIVVFLPKEKIAFTGDLIVHPVPLVGSTSYPLEYGATLERLRKLKARLWVPGHGPVMRDDSYLRSMIGLLDSIKQQTEASFLRGETLEQMRKRVDLESFRKAFAGDSQHKSFVFKNYVTLPAIAAAYRQLTERSETRASAETWKKE